MKTESKWIANTYTCAWPYTVLRDRGKSDKYNLYGLWTDRQCLQIVSSTLREYLILDNWILI